MVVTDGIMEQRLFLREGQFDELAECDKMNFLFCTICGRFYNIVELGGDCSCSTQTQLRMRAPRRI